MLYYHGSVEYKCLYLSDGTDYAAVGGRRSGIRSLLQRYDQQSAVGHFNLGLPVKQSQTQLEQ